MITGVSECKKLDGFPNPITKEEFKEYCEALSNTITANKLKDEYPAFISELVQKICLPRKSAFEYK